jgi:hypothetical protein
MAVIEPEHSPRRLDRRAGRGRRREQRKQKGQGRRYLIAALSLRLNDKLTR